MRNRYLIAYDVSDDKRRTAVFKALLANGNHVQFSVFLCDLSDVELARLKGGLAEVINQRQDQVLILNMGDAAGELAGRLECLGKGYCPPVRVNVI